jgi:hypothetical protein
LLSQLIKEQINLARKHGIYGLGINCYWLSGKTFDSKPIDLYLDNDIKYKYFHQKDI